jgi:murein L,D-transpeptidase YafK
MSNPEFDLLKPLIDTSGRTPVIISDQPNWVKPEHLDITRKFFNDLLDQWVSDWESRDPKRYLQHYSKQSFSSKNYNYASWATHKTQVNSSKSLIDVNLSDISLFAYPGETDMVVAEFKQQYHSNNFDSSASKRQYWQLDDNKQWKIIFEGSQ